MRVRLLDGGNDCRKNWKEKGEGPWHTSMYFDDVIFEVLTAVTKEL